MEKYNVDLRDAFFNELYAIAKRDSRLILLSDDFGAPSLDKFREDLSSQYINAGISEQNMISAAAGLALCGKIVYAYAIAPFITLRCYEQIKLDLCNMDLHVTAVGVGAGYSYDTAGPTHHAIEDISVMRALPNIAIYCPSDPIMAEAFARVSYENPGPKYIRFDRGRLPLLYKDRSRDFEDGLTSIKEGRDLCIISTGTMVGRAIEVAEILAGQSIDAGVVDLYRIKPLNQELLMSVIGGSKRVVTIEEHLINGGLGSMVAEMLLDTGSSIPLKRIGLQDESCFSYGTRESIHYCCGLDAKSVTDNILNWMR